MRKRGDAIIFSTNRRTGRSGIFLRDAGFNQASFISIGGDEWVVSNYEIFSPMEWERVKNESWYQSRRPFIEACVANAAKPKKERTPVSKIAEQFNESSPYQVIKKARILGLSKL